MQTLALDSDPNLTHVIHIADLHVRIGDKAVSRSEEYAHVFNNFIANIKALQCVKDGTAIVVLAGDVYHNKGRVDSVGGTVLLDFINKLLNLAPILVIAGNHDFRQEAPDVTDTVEMLVKPYEAFGTKYPIHYLKHTGHYLWKNIGIGMCSVKDTLRKLNTAGVVNELPAFPDASLFPPDVRKVALFHGSISQSALPNGRQLDSIASGYPLAWMNGYEMAMLGDNHKQQLQRGLNDTLLWGYPGSLIQQDDGEPTMGHGYLLWDLATVTATPVHIQNDFGAISVIRNDLNELLVRMSAREIVPLWEAVRLNGFPKTPKVRIVGTTGIEVFVKDELMARHVRPSSMKYTKCIGNGGGANANAEGGDTSGAALKTSICRMSEVNSPEQWEDYMKKTMPAMNVSEWIYDPSKILMTVSDVLPTGIRDAMISRNKSIQDKLGDYEAVMRNVPQTCNIVFKCMEWSYLMCFGADNYFDFESTADICLLNGKNAAGKSSFLDVICIAIYGSPTSSRNDTTDVRMSANILHNFRPAATSAGTALQFSIDNKLYEIRRLFRDFGATSSSSSCYSSSVKDITNDEEPILIAEGTTMVNDWVYKHFGTLDEMLMSTVLCQMDNTSFFFQKGDEQKRLIDKSLNLETIAAYQNILSEAIKGYKAVALMLNTYIRGVADTMESRDTVEMAAALESLEAEMLELTKQIEEDAIVANGLHMKIGEGGDSEEEGDDEEGNGNAKEELRKATQALNGVAPVSVNKDAFMVLQGKLANEADLLEKEGMDGGYVLKNGGSGEGAEATALKAILINEKKKPVESTVTRSYILDKRVAYDNWKAEQHDAWLNDIPGTASKHKELEREYASLQAQLTTLNDDPVVKPSEVVKKVAAGAAATGSLNELRERAAGAGAALRDHLQAAPDACRPRAIVETDVAESQAWLVAAPVEWVANIPAAKKALKKLTKELDLVDRQADTLARAAVVKPALGSESAESMDITQIAKITKELASYTAIVPCRPESGFPAWQAELTKWNSIQVPEETAVAMKARLLKARDDEAFRQRLVTSCDSLRTDIAELEGIPFNSECWACCAHHKPSQDNLAAKRELLASNTETLGTMSVEEQNLYVIEGLEKSIPIREFYENNVERITCEAAAWGRARGEWESESKRKALDNKLQWLLWIQWDSQNQEVRKLLREKRVEVDTLNKFLLEAPDMLEKGRRGAAELLQCDAFEAWQKEKVRLGQLNARAAGALWTLWKTEKARLSAEVVAVYKRICDLGGFLEGAAMWETEIMGLLEAEGLLTKWEAWKATADSLQATAAAAVWDRKMRACMKATAANDAALATIIEYDELVGAVLKWQRRIWGMELMNIEKDLKQRRDRAAFVAGEIAKLRGELTVLSGQTDAKRELQAELGRLQNDLERLGSFNEAFVGTKAVDGFKITVYKERVIPLIENEVNSFLETLDDFKLRISMVNCKFVYFVEDRGNRPALDHCSGYQKFLIGLAMRCALSRIGAVGQRVKHLFLDESFVACDADNILKVREILYEVVRVGGYKSVMLMSHLDHIREVAQTRADIDRAVESKFSSIRFGKPYVKNKAQAVGALGGGVVVKKRGRPKKAVAVTVAQQAVVC